MSTVPRTARGERTKAKIVASARETFAAYGFHEASIVKITEAAGVALGTFYLYFPGKLELFTEVVIDLNRQLRKAMSEGSRGATTRLEAERGGFRAYFNFIARNPEVYPIIREAWFVAPEALHLHYERIQSGYTEALAQAVQDGEIAAVDPEVTAWALMGIGEMVGMRYQSWPDPSRTSAEVSDEVFEACMTLITNALTPRKDPHG